MKISPVAMDARCGERDFLSRTGLAARGLQGAYHRGCGQGLAQVVRKLVPLRRVGAAGPELAKVGNHGHGGVSTLKFFMSRLFIGIIPLEP
jgi:hypothetical protein